MSDKNVTPDILRDLYVDKSKSEILKIYNISDGVLNRWLKESNIDNKNGHIYNFNKNIFDIIDIPEKAYWLGFIWCDGYNMKRQRNNHWSYEFKLDLAEQDIGHLEKFNRFLNSNRLIRKYKQNAFNKDTTVCRIYICNKHFGKTLYDKYGFIPNRYDINPLINNVPEEYHKDLIRGIIDAEGYIGSNYVNDNSKGKLVYKAGLTITTYENLLDFVQEYLIKNKVIINYSQKLKRHKDRDMYCTTVSYCGNVQIPRILNHFYKDATIYLDRKYLTYKNIIKIINRINNIS